LTLKLEQVIELINHKSMEMKMKFFKLSGLTSLMVLILIFSSYGQQRKGNAEKGTLVENALVITKPTKSSEIRVEAFKIEFVK